MLLDNFKTNKENFNKKKTLLEISDIWIYNRKSVRN